MTEHDKSKFGRRDFLRAIGLGAGAGIAMTVVAAGPLATSAAATESDAEKKKARYNPNAEDVKNYYRVNRS
ncbi:MAG: formate dehydrogenase [Rhodopseudomonas sp.]|nr:formate dehydrogenase [Rhodopseudomonas sp.]